MYSFFLYLIQVSEVGCSICCTSFWYAQVLLRPGTWASRPRQKKRNGCLCAHISVVCLTASRARRPRPWLRSGTFVPTKRGLSGLRRLSAFSAISARHYHHQRDVVASRDVGVSPAIKPNPERGDYETLVVSRSVLSGSTKLMLKGPWASLVTA